MALSHSPPLLLTRYVDIIYIICISSANHRHPLADPRSPQGRALSLGREFVRRGTINRLPRNPGLATLRPELCISSLTEPAWLTEVRTLLIPIPQIKELGIGLRHLPPPSLIPRVDSAHLAGEDYPVTVSLPHVHPSRSCGRRKGGPCLKEEAHSSVEGMQVASFPRSEEVLKVHL